MNREKAVEQREKATSPRQNVSSLESLLPDNDVDPDADTEPFGMEDAAEGADAANQLE